MTKEELIRQIEPIIRDVFEIPDLVMDEKMSPETLNVWSSLKFVQLLSAIEDKFGFKFRIMEIPMLENMGDILEVVLQHISK